MCERKSWTKIEDRILKLLYEQRGFKKWSDVAEIMRSQYGILGRNGKQCRQRYHNHLDDKISKAEWTPKEDETLLMLHNRLGNRWALIAREIKGRTDNCVKNRFYSRFRRSIRNVNELIKIFWKKKFKQLKPTFISKVIQITEEYRTTQDADKKEVFELCQNLKCRLISYSDRTEEELKQNDQAKSQLFQLIKQINCFNRKNKRKGKKKKREHSDYDEEQYCQKEIEDKEKLKRPGPKVDKDFSIPMVKKEQSGNNPNAIIKQQTFPERQIYYKNPMRGKCSLFPRDEEKNSEEKRSTQHQKVIQGDQLSIEGRQQMEKRKVGTQQCLEEKFEDGFDVYEFYSMENHAYNPHQFFY